MLWLSERSLDCSDIDTSDSYQYQVWKLCHFNKAPIITEFLQKKGIIVNEILNSGVAMLNLTFQKIRSGTPS